MPLSAKRTSESGKTEENKIHVYAKNIPIIFLKQIKQKMEINNISTTVKQ